MVPALDLVRDLKRQGVTFQWGKKGVSASGDLTRLTPDYREALAAVQGDLEVFLRWQALQDESEQRFGGSEARLYPFLRLDLLKAPVVRTTQGRARIARVVPDGCDVVFEKQIGEWRIACLDAERQLPLPPMTRLGLDQVFPPTTPPEEGVHY